MQSNNVTLASGVPWDAIAKTQEVHPTMVADFVKRGWVILASYMARSDVSEQTYENGYIVNKTRCEYEPVVLMGETEIASLREQNVILQGRVTTLEPNVEILSKLRGEYESLNRKFKDTEAAVARARESQETVRKDRDTLHVLKCKLEADIGKLRAAMGEIRMKEILAG